MSWFDELVEDWNAPVDVYNTPVRDEAPVTRHRLPLFVTRDRDGNLRDGVSGALLPLGAYRLPAGFHGPTGAAA